MRAALLIGLLILGGGPALAGEADDLRALAAKDAAKAAKQLDKLLSSARKKSNLPLLQELEPLLPSLVTMKGERALAGDLVGALKKAGGSDAYAYISAHHLAYDALFQATAKGNREDTGWAVKHATTRGKAKYGKYAVALGRYAAALDALAAEKPADAIAALETTLRAAVVHRWAHLALHAGIELTCVQGAAGQADAAKKTPASALEGVPADVDVSMLYTARSIASRRLKADHSELEKIWVDALTARIEKYSSGAPAGAGGVGRSPKLTPIGRALKKWKRTKPLITIARFGDEFRITDAITKEDVPPHRRKAGITHVEVAGMTLAFWDTGIRLQFISPNNEAVPGAGAAPGRWQHFDYPAGGEAWSLYISGEIRVTKAKK